MKLIGFGFVYKNIVVKLMLFVASIQKTKDSHKIHKRISRNRQHVMRGHPLSKLTVSQKIALKWRNMYGLPSIHGRPRPDAIRDLQGMMKTDLDIEENPVDAIREIRENIY